MNHTAVASRVIEYPGSDGQPMAETPVHRDVMIDAIQSLTRHFAERSDVYVSGNMLMYYEEGNPRKSVAPDVFVVVGASRDEDRDTYLLWREPKAPDFVLEVTSKSTRRNDQITKRALYESLGVAEYFMFDPRAEYLNPPLQGFGLHRGRYVALEVARLPDGAPALPSEALGLSLHLRGQALRLHDPATGEDLLTLEEEAAARRAVEAENARLRARIRELERSERAPEPPRS
ncbi:MAG: Uma2 family endonuclease [Chromatiales bacterium]|nr:Uma2 family endonuclease [Chromatiales bacterium]